MDVSSHSKFFDRLVELVPAKYYLAADSEQVNLKYLKKSARDEAKAAFKQQYKQNKRAKLDPDQARTTLQLQKQHGKAAAAGAAESDTDDDDNANEQVKPAAAVAVALSHPNAGQLVLPSGKPPSREELRQKLHQKLELLRKERKVEEQQGKVAEAKQWRDKKLEKGRKAAQEKQKLQKLNPPKQQQQQQPGQKQQRQPEQQQQQQQLQDRKRQKLEGGLHFSKVEFGAGVGDGKAGPGGKKRKPTKAELLAVAETRQAQAQQQVVTSEGKAALQREAWGAALARASGEKVRDDPRLLRRSLKKDAKLKAKKAAAWQDRVSRQKEQQQAKQDKRKENIDSRIKARQEKRKARRERKLLRAGFEGRKQGFIATPKAA